ncbi:MAG TPA: hypothetical protein VGO62_21450 [Myxococcota bacterium]
MVKIALALALATTTATAAASSSPLEKKTVPIDAKPAIAALVAKYPSERARIERGVAQVASLWRASDGDLTAFCSEQFLADDKDRALVFGRYEYVLEQLDGNFLEISRALNWNKDVDTGPPVGVDEMFAGWDAAAHVTDDMFENKTAFVALLNWPVTSLDERMKEGAAWTREQWAQSRMVTRFSRRVPADINKRIAEAQAGADVYINNYNLWMHHILDQSGARVFPSGKRLISHWNLRDELKAQYANGTEGTNRQRVIVKLMERIVTQSIPADVVNNPRLDYNPFTNDVKPSPAEEIEKDAPVARAHVEGSEPNTRYARLLDQFRAQKAADPYSPNTPNAIQRSFELGREMPEARVKKLFEDVLTSPLVPRVANEIEHRLGRKLEPQDLWYDGFKARSSISEDDLDKKTRKLFPTADAYKAAIPGILEKLGFTKEKAKYLADHILVDPARGAGHAMQAERRGDLPHLRTRIEKDGMNYKGFNIAVHEMGHNIEQTFSLYEVDHTLLKGVPNNAFTEAIAFQFQDRDLELLDIKDKDADAAKREKTLSDFWQCWEIAGVALVDVGVWHWMYDHPSATPAELNAATNQIANEMWRKYYAPVLGGSDGTQSSPLLGIYSHMIAYPLYLSDYPLGHLISFQIGEQIEKAKKEGKRFGDEIERIAKLGNIAPDLWMQNASGKPVTAQPLLDATEHALAGLAKK